jgi:hypothetical protein
MSLLLSIPYVSVLIRRRELARGIEKIMSVLCVLRWIDIGQRAIRPTMAW